MGAAGGRRGAPRTAPRPALHRLARVFPHCLGGRCREPASSRERGGGSREGVLDAVGIEQQQRHVEVPVAGGQRAPERQGPRLRGRSRPRRVMVFPCWSNHAMSFSPGRNSAPPCRNTAGRSGGRRLRSAIAARSEVAQRDRLRRPRAPPVDPVGVVVLAIGVVVAVLRPAHLVAGQEHRRAGGGEQGRQHRPLERGARRGDRRRRRVSPSSPQLRREVRRRARRGCPRHSPRCASPRRRRRRAG